jgi:uncharacterized membrane protein YeaQ/YmgE (transglycosylase-associated protein family)
MSAFGFFLLLFIAIGVQFLGQRVVPLVMPRGRLKTVGLGWVGGLVGSLVDGALWQWGPQVVGIYLVAAVLGSALFILGVGLIPFFRILLGRT